NSTRNRPFFKLFSAQLCRRRDRLSRWAHRPASSTRCPQTCARTPPLGYAGRCVLRAESFDTNSLRWGGPECLSARLNLGKRRIWGSVQIQSPRLFLEMSPSASTSKGFFIVRTRVTDRRACSNGIARWSKSQGKVTELLCLF